MWLLSLFTIRPERHDREIVSMTGAEDQAST
jgi:hypothetical protein